MTIRQSKSRVFAFDLATGNPVTGGAVAITAKWAIDYGAPTALTDVTPVEAEDGFYHFDLSIAERDAEIIGEIRVDPDLRKTTEFLIRKHIGR